jgi:hypothetical protein
VRWGIVAPGVLVGADADFFPLLSASLKWQHNSRISQSKQTPCSVHITGLLWLLSEDSGRRAGAGPESRVEALLPAVVDGQRFPTQPSDAADPRGQSRRSNGGCLEAAPPVIKSWSWLALNWSQIQPGQGPGSKTAVSFVPGLWLALVAGLHRRNSRIDRHSLIVRMSRCYL